MKQAAASCISSNATTAFLKAFITATSHSIALATVKVKSGAAKEFRKTLTVPYELSE